LLPVETIEEIREAHGPRGPRWRVRRTRKRGQNFMGLCPSTREVAFLRGASSEQVYKCFGCGAGGDCIYFIARIERTDFLGATKIQRPVLAFNLERVPSQDAERVE